MSRSIERQSEQYSTSPHVAAKPGYNFEHYWDGTGGPGGDLGDHHSDYAIDEGFPPYDEDLDGPEPSPHHVPADRVHPPEFHRS